MILAVHGYEVLRKGSKVVPGKLAEAVCQVVMQNRDPYCRIFLLGGWHLPIGPRPTIAEVMQERLIRLGVRRISLKTQFSYAGTACLMPPRDTAEEVSLLGHMLEAAGFDPTVTPVDVACIPYYIPRVRLLYRRRRAKIGKFILHAWTETYDAERLLTEPLALAIVALDISGLIEHNRARRTLDPDNAKYHPISSYPWRESSEHEP